MNRYCFATCLLAVAGSSLAQNISPDALYERSEGGGFCTSLGAFAAGRYQFADGNQRVGSKTMKSLAFRLDHRDYNILNGMGREWSNVSINMSECFVSTFNPTFSSNPATTPTQVFNQNVTWPVQLGTAKFLPDFWTIAMPFTTSWTYSGSRDILTDITFAGGTLANSASWSGSTAHPYYLDSFHVATFTTGPSTTLGHVNGGCIDSATGGSVGASVRMDTTSYGPSLAAPFTNKYFIQATGSDFAPNSTAMLILAFLADVDGFPFPGITCNNVHLDFRRTWFFHPVRTTATGAISPYSFGISAGLAPYTTAWAGVNLICQAAWNDSANGVLKLSSGSRNSFLALPYATSAAVNMKTVYDYDSSRTSASFSLSGASSAIPIMRYGN